jgi:peroxiredoxin
MITALALSLALGQSQGIEAGKAIPDLALTDMAGKTVRLSSFRGKKLILFNWASW